MQIFIVIIPKKKLISTAVFNIVFKIRFFSKRLEKENYLPNQCKMDTFNNISQCERQLLH